MTIAETRHNFKLSCFEDIKPLSELQNTDYTHVVLDLKSGNILYVTDKNTYVSLYCGTENPLDDSDTQEVGILLPGTEITITVGDHHLPRKVNMSAAVTPPVRDRNHKVVSSSDKVKQGDLHGKHNIFFRDQSGIVNLITDENTYVDLLSGIQYELTRVDTQLVEVLSPGETLTIIVNGADK